MMNQNHYYAIVLYQQFYAYWLCNIQCTSNHYGILCALDFHFKTCIFLVSWRWVGIAAVHTVSGTVHSIAVPVMCLFPPWRDSFIGFTDSPDSFSFWSAVIQHSHMINFLHKIGKLQSHLSLPFKMFIPIKWIIFTWIFSYKCPHLTC